ncbi:MAG: hypothetical protein ABIR06_05025 [Cyclobacteriaceae bacterium]
MSDFLKNCSDAEIVDIIYTTISDHAVFANNWNELLFNPELNIPEIKNRIFCLWFSSCLDTVNEEQQQYLFLLGQARHRGLKNCEQYLYQFGNLVESIKRRIRLFTEDQQIVIVRYRNTFTHGRLTGIHQVKIRVAYLSKNNDQITRQFLTKSEYWKKIDQATPREEFDSFLTPLRELFFEEQTDYLKNIVTLSKPEVIGSMHRYVYSDLRRPETPS